MRVREASVTKAFRRNSGFPKDASRIVVSLDSYSSQGRSKRRQIRNWKTGPVVDHRMVGPSAQHSELVVGLIPSWSWTRIVKSASSRTLQQQAFIMHWWKKEADTNGWCREGKWNIFERQAWIISTKEEGRGLLFVPIAAQYWWKRCSSGRRTKT